MSRLNWLACIVVWFVVGGCQDGGQVPSAGDGNAFANLTPEILAGLKYSGSGAQHYEARGRVRVDVQSAWGPDDVFVVRATFSPEDKGFHLYSCGLPRNGIEGLGRPTLVEVAKPDDFGALGALVTDKQAMEFEGDSRLHVYPDGPVTLFLPLKFKSAVTADRPVALNLTYMSCSKNLCNRPIEGAAVEILAGARPGR